MNNILKMSPDGIILYYPEDTVNWETAVKEQKTFLRKINDELNTKLKETPMTGIEIDRWVKDRLGTASPTDNIYFSVSDPTISTADNFNNAMISMEIRRMKNENCKEWSI